MPAGELLPAQPRMGSARFGALAFPQLWPISWTCPIESPSCNARASNASHAPQRRGIKVMLSTIRLYIWGSLTAAPTRPSNYRGAPQVAPLKSQRDHAAGLIHRRIAPRERRSSQGQGLYGVTDGQWLAERMAALGPKPPRSVARPGRSGIGASRSLSRVAAKVR